MPRVPQYNGGQVLPMVRPGVMAQGAPSVEEAALPGRQLQQFGQGLSQAAGEIGAIAQREQERVNKVRFNDAYNRALSEANRLKAEYRQMQGSQAVSGVNGVPLAEYYRGQLQKALASIAQDMKAPDVRDGFILAAGDLEAGFVREAETWEVEQGTVYADQVRDATVVSAFDAILANPGDVSGAAFHLTRARGALRDKLTDAGYSGDALDQQMKSALAKSHNAVIESLMNAGNPDGAKAYYDRHRGDYLEVDAAPVDALFEQSAVTERAFQKVSGLMDQVETGGMNRSAARAEVNAITDPAERAAARDELDYRLSRMDADRAAGEQARARAEAAEARASSEIYENWDLQIRTGAATVADIPIEDFRRLSPAMRDALQGLGQEPPRQTDLVAYDEFQTLLGAGTEAEKRDALNFLNSNAGLFEHGDYMRLRASVREPGDMPEDGRTDIQAVQQALLRVGIDKQEDRGLLHQSYAVWREEFQRTLGRAPTDKERNEKLDELTLRVRFEGVGGGFFRNSSSRRLYEVTDLPDDYGIALPQHEPIVAQFFADSNPSPQLVRQVYRTAMERLAAQGIENPNRIQLEMAMANAAMEVR